jgi:hypothetical protein
MVGTGPDKCRHQGLTSIVIQPFFPLEGHGDFFSTSDPWPELVVLFTTPTFPRMGTNASKALF